MYKIYPVILCGGSGSRLWPLSRENHPKQLLRLGNEYTLFQHTLHRVANKKLFKAATLLCKTEYKDEITAQSNQIKARIQKVIVEPFGKNTAPAITAAALALAQNNNDPVIATIPSDHVIEDIEAFEVSLRNAATLAETGRIVMLGIQPTAPNSNYGYICTSDHIEETHNAYTIAEFIEKPAKERAEDLIKTENCYWNSGIFVFKTSTFLKEAEELTPNILHNCKNAIRTAHKETNTLLLDKESFGQSPSISVDYAIMEKTDKACVTPLLSDWDDMGSWDSIWNKSPRDNMGTAAIGNVFTSSVKDSYLYATHRCLTVVGIDGIVVVETPDAVLVAGKDELHKLKDIYSRMKSEGRNEITDHTQKTTAWGEQNTLLQKHNASVKHICLNTKQNYKSENKTLHVISGELRSPNKTYKTGEVISGESVIENKSSETAELLEIEFMTA